MTTLLNVYVILLLIAGIIALTIGDSVTRPLQAISEKLKAVKLNAKNEPLEWGRKDEIGELVEEYNKMILELERSAELLAQSNKETAWREMAKQVAHEIKNPLTPMKLSIQHLQRAVIAKPMETAPLVTRVSHTLLEQINSLSHIASEFSNFAKMPRARNEHLDFNQLVSSVHALFWKQDRHIEILLEMPKETFFVFADKDQLLRVLNNLVKNAIQAIPDDREGRIVISLFKNPQGMAVVCVEDNGVGIPEDKQDSVFVPNFTTKSSGTGLGLAISKNIVESAFGKIYFETIADKGTAFYVVLPISKNE